MEVLGQPLRGLPDQVRGAAASAHRIPQALEPAALEAAAEDRVDAPSNASIPRTAEATLVALESFT